MKKFLLVLCSLLVFAGIASAQKVFVVVYATSDDGFLNVRSKPSNSGTILTTLSEPFHGLGDGMLIERGQSWSKVKVGKVVGWCYNKYLGTQSWYENNGQPKLIAKREVTNIYGEDYSGEGRYPVLFTVPRGTIIADEYTEGETFYILETAHDCLLIRKSDVTVSR